MILSDKDYTILNENVSKCIKKDASISNNIVVINEKDGLFYQRTVRKFISILQKIANNYVDKITANNFNDKLVALLEKNVPFELIPYIRKNPPFLNFTRLDFHGRYVIEYNSSPGFLLLTSLVNSSLKELGLYEKYGLGDSTEKSICADKLLWEKVFPPLLKKAKYKTIAIFDRIGNNYSSNIYGELEYLSQYVIQNSYAKVIFPCSDKDFEYINNQLIHKKSHLAVGVVHIAASEGQNFERWISLVNSPIFKAYKENNVELWPAIANCLFTSKFLLAYLSDVDYDKTLQISPDERIFLNDVLPWTRILTPSVAQTAKWMVKNGLRIVIKPGHGSGGRGVHILNKNSDQYSYLLNKNAKKGNHVCMGYTPASKMEKNIAYTTDIVMFLDDKNTPPKPSDIIYTSRVFMGEKVNTVTEGAGISPIMFFARDSV